jgi:hypothetical protein
MPAENQRAIDADLVAWTHGEGAVPIETIAKWHERPKTEIAKCLPLDQFLKVWESELTPAERAELVPVLLRQEERVPPGTRCLTPTELARDKTFRRISKMFPNS